MNKLIEKTSKGNRIFGFKTCQCKHICITRENCDNCPVQRVFDRLAEYENTGMTPEKISAIMGHNTALIEQLRGFEEAKENDLQIEVPLEVGKTVFAIFDTFDIYGNRCFKIKKLYVKRYEYDYLKVLTIVCGDPHIDRHIRTGEYRFLEEDIGKCLFEIEKEAFLKAAMALGVKI